MSTSRNIAKDNSSSETTGGLVDLVVTTNLPVKSENIAKDSSSSETADDLDYLVTQVKFKWSKLPRIPSKIFSKFKKLIIFDGSGIGLRHLDSMSFQGSGSLEMIFLQNNELTSLNAYCFVHSTSLTVLNLSNNKITNVQGSAFTALSKLETLTLSNNNIKLIEDSTFNSLSALKWIGLDNNLLSVVSSDLFVSTKETLKGIYLNKNKIAMISPYAFDSLNKLRFLTLSGNQCVDKDFLNHIIQENTAIKFELRQCHKEYRGHEFSEDAKYKPKWNVDRLENANKVCIYESMKIIKELFVQ